jgi:hypothetical protein
MENKKVCVLGTYVVGHRASRGHASTCQSPQTALGL